MEPVTVTSLYVCPRCGSLDVRVRTFADTNDDGETAYWALMACSECPTAPVEEGRRLACVVLVSLTPTEYVQAVRSITRW